MKTPAEAYALAARPVQEVLGRYNAVYRFNRRFRLAESVPRLLRAMVLYSLSPEPLLRRPPTFKAGDQRYQVIFQSVHRIP